MDKLINAAQRGNLKIFKQLEKETKDIDWQECFSTAFLKGNFNIVKYCEDKGEYGYCLLPYDLEDINFTHKQWKRCMYWAAGIDKFNTFMWCELKVAEGYGCVIGLKNFKTKIDNGSIYIEKDEDDFYEKVFSGQDEYLENSLPSVKFPSGFSTVAASGDKVDVISREGDRNKMIKCLRKALKNSKGEVTAYLEDKLGIESDKE
uniref:Ankyrin repeat protein n=1 Tax=Pithovirus LCPAC401 TaxID=2506595 RepID=A0A481ZAK4_9VIRU|nr:MAG: hypothetical protein LCPAC401_01430 [Pithovirus LCPAC401]